MKIQVSIIIVNYNTQTLTKQCIDSILQQTKGVSYEIIVVDNASTDGSKEYFSKDKNIKYIYNNKNIGFGAANNVGMKVAVGEYIFLLNSDTILLNDAVSLFYAYGEAHPNTVLGCYLQTAEGQYASSFHYFPAFTIKDFLLRQLRLKKHIKIDYQEHDVECICGADMFIPRNIIEKVGMFDENIFLYGEEGEWQYRMAQQNIFRRVIPSPKIVHLEGQSMSASLKKQCIKYESHFYVLEKYMDKFTLKLAKYYYYYHFAFANRHQLKNPEVQSILNIFK
ncbi:glycosyltransferase family 2 protein [Prevotella ihumii]|uniref:glycosyltransferase family 2 protein n=1 Tax=Prevotella ihumii TaxID=1917878 RepID=UPI0009825E51|nr:glycosyltransferase family 2 protein [Prevotella ihumii]